MMDLGVGALLHMARSTFARASVTAMTASLTLSCRPTSNTSPRALRLASQMG